MYRRTDCIHLSLPGLIALMVNWFPFLPRRRLGISARAKGNAVWRVWQCLLLLQYKSIQLTGTYNLTLGSTSIWSSTSQTMFIKKDLRKIPRIFADASKADDEELTEPTLQKHQEYASNSLLCLKILLRDERLVKKLVNNTTFIRNVLDLMPLGENDHNQGRQWVKIPRSKSKSHTKICAFGASGGVNLPFCQTLKFYGTFRF